MAEKLNLLTSSILIFLTGISFFTVCFIFILTLLLPQKCAGAEITILFLGDSLTAGLGVEQDEAYPALLEKMLGEKGYEDLTLVNAGISGSTTASAISRLKWYSRVKPDILFLALGANDGLRGLSLEAMEKNLEKAIVAALESGMKVILAGMEIPPNYGPEYTSNFRNVFKLLSEKHNIFFMPFLLKDVAGEQKYNQADGIHPNAEGHKIIASNVFPYINEMVKNK
ncbi:arylesterase [Desulfamplus magnetovallimortis]|nr:arylesterase [Desulfamplus magnetovallimortis]